MRHDIDFVAEHGVKFEYGCDPALTVDELRAQGFEYVLIGIGADKSSGVRLEGSNARVTKSLGLPAPPQPRRGPRPGRARRGRRRRQHGHGLRARGAARARREGCDGDLSAQPRRDPGLPRRVRRGRRGRRAFRFLTNPERFEADGSLTCRVMELGAPDENGRRRPLATDQTVSLKVDALITAIGEQADADALRTLGVPLDDKGRPIVDLATGETARSGVLPDRRRAEGPVVDRLGHRRREARDRRDPAARDLKSHHGDKYWLNASPAAIAARKGAVVVNIVKKDELKAFVKQEGERCLQCNYVCGKCVDVCPNRANISVAVPGFKDRFQTLHVDAFCNECGNCASFCPWQGRPYKDKVTIFSLRQDFDDSTNAGFLVEGSAVRVRQGAKVYDLSIDGASRIANAPPELTDLCPHRHAGACPARLSAEPGRGVKAMLILQDVTAVQFEPAQVQSGIDIAIEGSLIKAVGVGLSAQYPQAEVRPMHGRLVMPGHRLLAQPLLLGPRARHHGQHRAVPGLHLHAEEPLVAAGPGAGRGVALLQRPRLLARSHQERLHRRHRSPCVAELHWRLARHPAQGLPGSRPARHHLLRNHAPQRRGRRAQGRCRRERGLCPADRCGQGEGRRTLSGGGHDRCARAVHDSAPGHGAAA